MKGEMVHEFKCEWVVSLSLSLSLPVALILACVVFFCCLLF